MNGFEPMTDREMEIFSNLKSTYYQSTPLWRTLSVNQAKYQKDLESLKSSLNSTLERVKDEILGKQYNLCGKKNAWILKPGGSSRGRGVRCFSKYKAIVESAYGTGDSTWVVQKYIENPMVIKGRKFDIR